MRLRKQSNSQANVAICPTAAVTRKRSFRAKLTLPDLCHSFTLRTAPPYRMTERRVLSGSGMAAFGRPFGCKR